MRNPNGYGGICKLSGNRRKPFRVRKTQGYDENGRQIYVTIGYYETRAKAMEALANYNQDPYDLSGKTFKDIYEKWLEIYHSSDSNQRQIKSCFNHSKPLWDKKFSDIRPIDLEATIRKADVGNPTKVKMKSMYNMMWKFALKNNIVTKNVAELCEGVKKEKAKIKRNIFTAAEIEKIKANIDFPYMKMVLIGIYTGMRPTEICIAKKYDDDFIISGVKTESGRDRLIPIHQDIKFLIKDIEVGEPIFPNMTYYIYRYKFAKIIEFLGSKHTMHDTRHTFTTIAKEQNMNEYILKRILGHTIRDITEQIYTHRDNKTLLDAVNKLII